LEDYREDLVVIVAGYTEPSVSEARGNYLLFCDTDYILCV